MSLRPGWSPPATHLNIISGRGGLGDQIARLPAYRYMLETYSHVSATIWVQDYFIDLAEYLLPQSPRLTWRKLSEAPWTMAKPIVEFDMDRITTLHSHLTRHAFAMLLEDLNPSQEMLAYPKANFVSHFDSYRKEFAEVVIKGNAVVFTTDYTALARQWPAVHINTLAKKVREAGLTPVLLGTTNTLTTGVPGDDIQAKENTGIKGTLFVDLRNKTTLVEALAVMQRAKAVVGVDNGLLHLAHCTNTPVVMGFTTLSPEHRVPVRFPYSLLSDKARGAQLTKALEAQVPCKGCQSRGFAINTDWRECVMPESRYACTLTLTADRYMHALKELDVISLDTAAKPELT